MQGLCHNLHKLNYSSSSFPHSWPLIIADTLQLPPQLFDFVDTGDTDQSGQINAVIRTVNRKGRPCQVLIDDLGYDYTSPLLGGNNTLRWRCSKKKSFNCRSFVVTQDGVVIRGKRQHSHDPWNKSWPYLYWFVVGNGGDYLETYELANFVNKKKGVVIENRGSTFFKTKYKPENNTTAWRCSKYRSNQYGTSCKARLITSDKFIVGYIGRHNCHWTLNSCRLLFIKDGCLCWTSLGWWAGIHL